MTALISKLNITLLYLHLAWPNYGFDVLNITMHTEVAIHSMNMLMCGVGAKSVAHLMKFHGYNGNCKSKILNELCIICIKRQTHTCNKILKVKVTTTRSKVESR